MAKGCAAAQERSGERGWHAVYLQSAVQRTSDSPKTDLWSHYRPRFHVGCDFVWRRGRGAAAGGRGGQGP
eukprot:4569381-Prymnesium_polylepis.1